MGKVNEILLLLDELTLKSMKINQCISDQNPLLWCILYVSIVEDYSIQFTSGFASRYLRYKIESWFESA